jgi:hypothetical protein
MPKYSCLLGPLEPPKKYPNYGTRVVGDIDYFVDSDKYTLGLFVPRCILAFLDFLSIHRVLSLSLSVSPALFAKKETGIFQDV